MADDLVVGWPLLKFVKRWAQWQALDGPRRQPCVLLSTGAMNPVHRGHVELLERAKRELEGSHHFAVLGGWISASHDGYVGPKMHHLRAVCLPPQLRVRLVEHSVAHSDWIEAGLWEALGGHRDWPDFPEVAEELRRYLLSEYRDLPQDLLVFYACGLDHFERCGLSRGLGITRGLGVVVVPRDGLEAGSVDHRHGVFAASAAYATEESTAVASLSSTRLRAAMARAGEKQHEIRAMMVPAAADHLLSWLAKPEGQR